MLSGYSNAENKSHLLEHYQVWINSTLNPEGFRIVSSGILRNKRKNNDTNNNHQLDLRTDGVDLNRNYPVFWELDTEMESNSPYCQGSEPSSESEIKAIITLAQQQNFALAIFLHSLFPALAAKNIPACQGNGSELFQRISSLAACLCCFC